MIKPAMTSAEQRFTDTIVIGAGHAGLAVSFCLTERSIDHLVFERGEVANSWRTERWDSLKLFTPNWQTRLPGYHYSGSNPDGFMSVKELIGFIDSYAQHSKAPVLTSTTVTSVKLNADGYRVETNRGVWRCRSVVIASGACNLAKLPRVAADLPADIQQLTAREYKNPKQLQQGAVLIVGASATGIQLAYEIQTSGHQVTVSTGEHVRMPRLYRGRDIQWWMDSTGILDEDLDEIDDITRVRRLPSPQLVGSHEREILDLNVLRDLGVQMVGRLMGVNRGVVQFSGSLRNVCALADLKMNRLLKSIDDWVLHKSQSAEFPAAHRFAATKVDESPRLSLNLAHSAIRNVIWATGYRPDYSWLEVPVLDRKGMIRHKGGVADSAGMYLLGLPFLRQRKSSFIHGIEDDARFIAEHLAAFLK